MFNKSTLITTTILTTSLMATSVFAQAQEDEIIVTATKKEQTLQEIPIAVTVTDSVTIEQAKILDINDLQSVVPSLRVTQLQTSANTNFVIRGFGNGANNPGIEPSVGIFIDGVYRSRSAAQISDLPVLERVEVLRGPQSTIFGKNASAGVISVVTAKPSFEQEGSFEYTYGNFDQNQLKGYITGPLTENIAASLSGSYNSRDGFATSTNGLSDNNNRNRWNVRGDFLYQPTDNVEFRLIGDFSRIDEICCTTALIEVIDGISPSGTPFSGSNTLGILTSLGAELNDPNDPFDFEDTLNSDSVNIIQDGGISLQADVDLGTVGVTSITAYRENDLFNTFDGDFTSVDVLEAVRTEHNIKTFTQELRFNGSLFDQVDWSLGGFYIYEEIESNQGLEFGVDARAFIDGLAGGPAALGLLEATNGFAPGSFFSPETGTVENFGLDNQSFSFFGNFDYHLTDRFTFSFGGNYTRDTKDFFGTSVVNEPFSNLELDGQAATNALPTALQSALFPAFAAACGLGPLEFSAQNAGALAFAPACDGTLLAAFGVPGVTLPGSAFVNPAGGGIFFDVANGAAAATPLGVPCAPGQAPPACNPFLALQALQFVPQFLGFPNAFEDSRTEDNDFSYSVSGAYDVNDNINVYVKYATGFKASSVNLSRDSRPALSSFTDASGAFLPGAQGLFVNNQVFGTRIADPEQARVIEIGLKAAYENFAINLALFDQTLDDFQSNIFAGTGFNLVNAGEQSVRGVEWDVSYSPVEPLTLTWAGTFLDPEFDDFTQGTGFNNTIVDLTGERPAGIHSVSMTGSATYGHQFENGWDGFIRGDFIYESNAQIVDNFGDFELFESQGFTGLSGSGPVATAANLDNVDRSVFTVNASIGVDFGNGFALQGFVRNLFDEEFLLSAFPGVAQPGLFFGYPNPPRTYGVVGRYSF